MMPNHKISGIYDGNAIVYCEGAYNSTYGKTAHGLVRFTQRYKIISVVDSNQAGQDSGQILDGNPNNILIFDSIENAVKAANSQSILATHLVMGVAPDGGCLDPKARQDFIKAIKLGLNIDSGLHQFLSDDPEIRSLAKEKEVKIRDVRKPPSRDRLHFFSGKIEEVKALKIAILGTDSAIGKRTTAWKLVQSLGKSGYVAQLVGTGQTAWMQGARYSIILDSLVNDFVAGEIEHAVWSCWTETKPEVIVIEGQGSLMNPAYPGGFEILAAGRPDLVLLQHAPMRKEYDGFPGYPIQPISKQIEAIELISGKPVIAITINHEKIPNKKIPLICDALQQVTGLPTLDVLHEGADKLVKLLTPHLKKPGEVKNEQ
jgi:uncharacterized NAD-dependent epimerase/dehydratase family protein